jgi:hypothetical protein
VAIVSSFETLMRSRTAQAVFKMTSGSVQNCAPIFSVSLRDAAGRLGGRDGYVSGG